MSDVSEEKYAGVLAVANGWKARALSAEQREHALAAHVGVLEAMRQQAQEEYLLQHSDGALDCVTPYDLYDKPETSLARLIAEKQAEALTEYHQYRKDASSKGREPMSAHEWASEVRERCRQAREQPK